MIDKATRQTISLIQTRMEVFARGDEDDPKAIVDTVLHDIEAMLGEQGDAATTYLSDVTGHTKGMLINAERQHQPDQRRVLFLRSVSQLLTSRLNLSS